MSEPVAVGHEYDGARLTEFLTQFCRIATEKLLTFAWILRVNHRAVQGQHDFRGQHVEQLRLRNVNDVRLVLADGFDVERDVVVRTAFLPTVDIEHGAEAESCRLHPHAVPADAT